MSTELTLRLTDEQVQRLDRAAEKEKLGRSEAAEHLLELALRQIEFRSIQFFLNSIRPIFAETNLSINPD